MYCIDRFRCRPDGRSVRIIKSYPYPVKKRKGKLIDIYRKKHSRREERRSDSNTNIKTETETICYGHVPSFIIDIPFC